MSDLRVYSIATGFFAYPDLSAVCGERQFLDEERDTLLNPDLIAEVFSNETEGYDRGRKFEHYRSIPSLSEYLLLSSERIAADLFTRQPDGRWLLTTATNAEDVLELKSLACSIKLGSLYWQVTLESPSQPPPSPPPSA
jgi:Uma2 family endonuclease